MAEAREALKAVRVLEHAGMYGRLVSSAYYAMLDAARAALSEEERYAKTHTGTWDLFWLEFVGPRRFDRELATAARRTQRPREGVDYDALRMDEQEALEIAALAERFVAAVEEVLTR